jgi:cytochrome c556
MAIAGGLLTAVSGRAQQAPPAAGPLVPMTASSLLRNPFAHLGENVSLIAAVEAILSKTVFTLDQDRSKSTGQELLVIAPTLITLPDLNVYVTVQGEVLRFDPAEIAAKAQDYTLDLSPEIIAKFQGKPVVLARAVIAPSLVDIAKPVPRPMTPEEITFSEWMKAINPAFTAIRSGLEAPDAAQMKTDVAVLKKAFTNVETFFKARGTTDAIKWSADSMAAVATMERGAAGAKWEEVKAGAGSLQQMCTACHTAHRERMEDGTFRIRGRR